MQGNGDYISREAFLAEKRKQYCQDCNRRKGMKKGKYVFCYEIGEAPCRSCSIDDILTDVEDFPAADAIATLEHHVFLADLACKAEAAKAPRWIPVTERLPEPFESVLVCYQREGRYGTSCGHYYLDRGTTIWKASGIIPTHWMPLPEPPKEGE